MAHGQSSMQRRAGKDVEPRVGRHHTRVRFLPGSISLRLMTLKILDSFQAPSQCLHDNAWRMKCGAPWKAVMVLLMATLIGELEVGAAGVMPRTDREEAGLLGNVRSVITKEALLVETDHYDVDGRLLRRIEETSERHEMLGALIYISAHDAKGKRIAESVQDAKGTIIKQTAYGYEHRGHRTAEVSAWADGTFENASFYDYDDQGHRIRGLHFNAPNLANRNMFEYDAQGRVTRELYSRNYTYKRNAERLVRFPGFDDGYEVTIQYDGRGLISEKIISNLKRVRQSRSEFDYDHRRSQVEERIYDAKNVMTERKRYDYEYDEQGNWLSETLQWWDLKKTRPEIKRTQTRERTITYFK